MAGDLSNSNHTLNWTSDFQTQGEEIIGDGSGTPITVADSSNWTFPDDFTLEVFGFKVDANTTVEGIMAFYTTSGNQRSWLWRYDGASSPKVFQGTFSTNGSSFTLIESDEVTLTASQAYDICMERSGSTVRFYLDGTQVGSGTFAGGLNDATTVLRLLAQSDGNNLLGGRVKAIRITKGVARYETDTSYSVPSLPLPTST